ncbi:hypothetical protein D9613_008953 [Agrocybe pediades]|uniref:Alpha-type protein kinase domain-containing protein n=1 Tax=Agrocybe pediades TaxID=84607 RepID=A0A8H4QTK9_9AGAR|nr:hypothetical protein D9613_008953 [Agrocybe pediades]
MWAGPSLFQTFFSSITLWLNRHARNQMALAESFPLTVADGIEKGTSWLVDPLLKIEKERKFSGSQKAGTNSADLMGRSCDAFAHFARQDSEDTWVPVDIQGIVTHIIKDGRMMRSNKLVLYCLSCILA